MRTALSSVWRCVALCVALLTWSFSSSASAAICSPAGAQGAAPASWQSYCWLDMSTYNDATARSVAGQNFSFSLADGSTLTFNLKTTSTSATGAIATPAPSWGGAAVGNTSFLNIPGQPILYNTTNGARVTFDMTSITVIPPPGVASVTDYAFVIADAESTDNSEYLEYTTNGSPWAVLDTVAPISGTRYPVLTGVGTSTLRSAGGGQPSFIGAHIVGSNKPTTVRAVMQSGGLEGIMFAVRFASITLNKQISGSRIDPADQFTFQIQSTSSAAVLATGTTSGTSNGPFTAAVISTASGIPITLAEVMAPGSASALSQYQSSLTCTNGVGGSSTVMPTNVIGASYDFGSLSFGDIVECTFTNTPYPHISVSKQMGAGGRIFDSDQFTVRLKKSASILASATTTGTGGTILTGTTAATQVIAGDAHQLDELAAGSTILSRYTSSVACTNANAGSSTVLPTAIDENVTPVLGDVISCVVTNLRNAAGALLQIVKQSEVISDPFNGTTNPKAIPGAILRYTFTVTSVGDLPVDNNTIVIRDSFPANLTYNAASVVQYTEGATPSGLNSFNPATRVRFSNQPSGAGPYNYSPNTAGFDSNVTGIRIRPRGIMDESTGSAQPSFTVSFEMRVD